MDFDLKKVLNDSFKLDNFLPGQREIIETILKNDNTLIRAFPGSGRAVSYQLASLILAGKTLVITDARNQFIHLFKLNKLKIKSIGITAHSNPDSFYKEANDAKFIYLSPETLTMTSLISQLNDLNFTNIIIDNGEKYSIHSLFYDPAYEEIPNIIKILNIKKISIFAIYNKLEIEQDINVLFNGKKYKTILTGFDKKALHNWITRSNDKLSDLLLIIGKNLKNKSGIIYCQDRAEVIHLCNFLRSNNYNPIELHSGLSEKEIEKRTKNFIMAKYGTIAVADTSFTPFYGKGDINFAISFGLALSIDEYIAKAGTLAHDQSEAFSIIVYEPQDRFKAEASLERIFPKETDIINQLKSKKPFHLFESQDILLRYQTIYEAEMMLRYLYNSRIINIAICSEGSCYIKLNIQHADLQKKISYKHKKIKHFFAILNEKTEGLENGICISSSFLEELSDEKPAIQRLKDDGLIILEEFKGIKYFHNGLKKTEFSEFYKLKEYFLDNFYSFLFFVYSSICRKTIISALFNSLQLKKCGICDNCIGISSKQEKWLKARKREKSSIHEETRLIFLILNIVKKTKNIISKKYICDTLTPKISAPILKEKFKIKYSGDEINISYETISSLIINLIEAAYIDEINNKLYITEKGKNIILKWEKIIEIEYIKRNEKTIIITEKDLPLYAKIIRLIADTTGKLSIPYFMLMNDIQMKKVAVMKPKNKKELLKCTNMDKLVFKIIGKKIISLI